mmetsp:Transcript_132161/g.240426  ORF Transcript_132161/g.240426 Transcript_132161/m.240426 type:complete len:329 (+) Transcript_132161:62-1048(+)
MERDTTTTIGGINGLLDEQRRKSLSEISTMTGGSDGPDWPSRRKSMTELWVEYEWAPDVREKAAIFVNLEMPSLAAKANKVRVPGAACTMPDLPPMIGQDEDEEEDENSSDSEPSASRTQVQPKSSEFSDDSKPFGLSTEVQVGCNPTASVSMRLELARQQQAKLAEALREKEEAFRQAQGALADKDKEIEALEQELRNEAIKLETDASTRASSPQSKVEADDTVAELVGNKVFGLRPRWSGAATSMPELPVMLDDDIDDDGSAAGSEPERVLMSYGSQSMEGCADKAANQVLPALPEANMPRFHRRTRAHMHVLNTKGGMITFKSNE